MSAYRPRFFKLAKDEVFPGSDDPRVEPYRFTQNIAIAVDVALATGRPLLVAGPPGCGKTRLGETMAALLGWNFLHKTITSRTRLEELTVEIDHLERLHDAQRSRDGSSLKPDAAYYKPGIFWWAFDAARAGRRGCSEADAKAHGVAVDYPGTRRERKDGFEHTVLLIDEIDKAEPDLPNDLLEPLDRRCFSLPNGGSIDAADGLKVLTIITTNQERELPGAFLRRCVSLSLEHPDEKALVDIAKRHDLQMNAAQLGAVAARVVQLRKEALDQGRRAPGTSEFLDAVRACRDLNISPGDDSDPFWPRIVASTLNKLSPGGE